LLSRLVESAKAIEALREIVDGEVKPAVLVFGVADMAGDIGADTAWEPLLYVRSRIIQVTARAGIMYQVAVSTHQMITPVLSVITDHPKIIRR
jgi:citrate lyase beta subunit